MTKRGDYEVGYGKPPKQHQFKKGQSGNPRGRRKKEKRLRAECALRDEFLSALEAEVTVREGGKSRKMPIHEALVRQLIAKALAGDYRSMKLVMEQQHAWTLNLEHFRVKMFDLSEEYRLAGEERARLKAERQAAARKAAEEAAGKEAAEELAAETGSANAAGEDKDGSRAAVMWPEFEPRKP